MTIIGWAQYEHGHQHQSLLPGQDATGNRPRQYRGGPGWARRRSCVCTDPYPARPQQKQNSKVLVLTSMHVIKILESMVVWLVLFIGGNN